MKHSTKKSNAKHLVNHTPMSDVKLAGSKAHKPLVGKPFHLSGATKVEGTKKSRKK